MLTKFQFHCSITCRNILYFVFWLPYCHTLRHHQYLICITQKLWISLERYEIWQKWKHYSSSLLKAFQIHLFFNTSVFHFMGTLSWVLSRKAAYWATTSAIACENSRPSSLPARVAFSEEGVVALHASTESPSQPRVTSQPRVNHE